jgi:Flp pilus assembly protein TadD
VKLDGDSAKTECEFGKIAFRRSDLDAAYAHYSRALALNPGEAEAQVGLGRVLAATQKPEEAAKYLAHGHPVGSPQRRGPLSAGIGLQKRFN